MQGKGRTIFSEPSASVINLDPVDDFQITTSAVCVRVHIHLRIYRK